MEKSFNILQYLKFKDNVTEEFHDPQNPVEVRATSCVLLAAAYAIGSYCKDYNDDYMLCKRGTQGLPGVCGLEGRKVSRCTLDLLAQLEKHCKDTFFKYSQCIDRRNGRLHNCRQYEKPFNQCLYKELGIKKQVPTTPPGVIPIHLRDQYYYGVSAPKIGDRYDLPPPITDAQRESTW